MCEELAVEQAIHRHHLRTPHEDPPENMFAPFTVLQQGENGDLTRSQHAPVHWAHVDTGSMVNIVYQGVLDAFPGLERYR